MHAQDTLQALCGSASRYRVLKALYENPTQAYHFRGLAAAAEVDPSQVHKLLPRLIAAGLCEKVAAKPYPLYRACKDNPLFDRVEYLFRPIAAVGEVANAEVDLRLAPVLKSLLWTGRERDRIPAEEAFRNYERNWRFVRLEKLEPQEQQLIDQLARTYGAGLING